MSDDLLDIENKTEDNPQLSEDEDKPSSSLWRWGHFPAIAVFGLLFLMVRGSLWRWQIAICGGYTVYVFWLGFTNDAKDADDVFGDTERLRYAAKLLFPHALILTLVWMGVTEWFRLLPVLPDAITHEGRKGSLWDLFGWLVLGCAGLAEGFWMARRVKHKFGGNQD